MEEQPVALAVSARSPNSWVISLMYGVSPHPEQAPENSNSSCSNCESLTWLRLNTRRSISGIFRKKSQLAFSASRMGGCGAMLMARCLTSLLLLAGQTCTHRVQPVQSSGATCSVYFMILKSFHRAAVDLKAAGAPSRCCGSYTFARMTECGHTSTHLPHWMQSSSSQTGISSAMLRFSHCAVALGKVPSMGIALT